MPLIKAKLIKDLTDFFDNNNKSPSQAAKELAAIIDAYIKTATVTVTGSGIAAPGIPTAGTALIQATTAPVATTVSGTGTIS